RSGCSGSFGSLLNIGFRSFCFQNLVAEQAESIDNPLHEAAKRGNLSWLRECLDNRVGVNGLDKAGSTALYWACHGGHKDIVEMLFTQPNIELNQQVRSVRQKSVVTSHACLILREQRMGMQSPVSVS
uniref:Uncharacterized protein n=1 Tax=Canis lupus familiaris TaxID=9615 RepID=A0A8I3NL76_CANLF